jgi:DMSO/TMAO reductase YedYZ heme-binding membrane subunit
MTKFDRKTVIKYHTLIGFFALLFMLLHIGSILFDVGGWGDSIKLVNVFSPNFSGLTKTSISLGVIGMYLLIITVLTGIFFLKISKRFGYLTWVTIHRGSFFFYIFIFYHALRIGTDFRNIYIIIFFWQVFAVIGIYIVYLIFKTELVSKITKKALVQSGFFKVTISEIIESPQEYIGKRIVTMGTISKVKEHEDWFTLTKDGKTIYARMHAGFFAVEYVIITGTVKKIENTLFIEIEKVKV